MTSPVVEMKEVSHRFDARWAISDINILIEEGEYVGLVGPNGGGKTTSLKLILGLLKQTQGEVRVFGKPALRLSRIEKSQIGFVRQKAWDMDPSFPGTVMEVAGTALYPKIGFGRRLSAQQRKFIGESLELVGIGHLQNSLVRELSTGQQQRLYLARALSCEPRLLLLDEPTSAVDAKTQSEFFQLISNLRKEKEITIVLVSHDLETVAREVESLAIINQKLIFRGSVQEGQHHLTHQFAIPRGAN